MRRRSRHLKTRTLPTTQFFGSFVFLSASLVRAAEGAEVAASGDLPFLLVGLGLLGVINLGAAVAIFAWTWRTRNAASPVSAQDGACGHDDLVQFRPVDFQQATAAKVRLPRTGVSAPLGLARPFGATDEEGGCPLCVIWNVPLLNSFGYSRL